MRRDKWFFKMMENIIRPWKSTATSMVSSPHRWSVLSFDATGSCLAQQLLFQIAFQPQALHRSPGKGLWSITIRKQHLLFLEDEFSLFFVNLALFASLPIVERSRGPLTSSYPQDQHVRLLVSSPCHNHPRVFQSVVNSQTDALCSLFSLSSGSVFSGSEMRKTEVCAFT